MIRDYRDYLQDILDAINETQQFTYGMSYTGFPEDRKTVNAVIRSLEVIGEATSRIPSEIRVQAPKGPWKYMAGMRNKLIHEYFGVDLEIVWVVIQEELPPLRKEIEGLLHRLNS